MSLLENFKPFNFNEGVPYVSVTASGVTFNKAVVLKLNCPEYVRLLLDEKEPRIALQVCSSDLPNSVPFFKKKKTNVFSVRWNGRDLLNTIQRMTGWDLSKGGYRTDGTFLKEETAMLFDLTKAVELR